MSARGTLVLLVVALGLAGYVWWFELRGAEQKAEAEAAAAVIFTLEPASATGLELDTAGAGRAVLARGDAGADAQGWRVSAPIDYPADADAVDRALRALAKLSSTATIDVRPQDLEPFGLGANRKSVAVKRAEGEPQVLHLGGDTPIGGGRYVELASDPHRLYVVSAASLSGLTPTLLELRDKRLSRIAPSAVDAFSVSAGGTLLVRAVKTEAGWALVEPENAPADAERIRRVLDDLALARASGFEDQPKPRESYGLEPPTVELSLRAGEREEKLALGSADGAHWLERAGDPVILAVNERVVTNVPLAFFDYRAKRVLTLDVTAVRALELEYPRGQKKHRLIREGESWKAEEAGVELKPLGVEDLLYSLAAVDATGLETTSLDRAQVGLEPALATVRAFGEDAALLAELSFGDPHPERGLPALSSQSPLVWRVSNDIGRDLPLSPEAFANLLVKSAPAPAPAVAEPDEPEPPASP